MQDQVVFVLDVEQLVGLGQGQEEKQESGINAVKQALLRLAVSCSDASRIWEQSRDLPSIGFRFYSSTEYFSIPSNLTGDWLELNSDAWSSIDQAITERLDQVLQPSAHNEDVEINFIGPKSRSPTLVKVLEEVVTLYSWDRPALKSPVKKARKETDKLGNSVFVLTKLPQSMKELEGFLPSSGIRPVGKSVTFREVGDAILSKRVRGLFGGELNIGLHIVDTSSLHNVSVNCPDVVNLFNRALKDVRGSVIPLSVLCEINNTSAVTSIDNNLLSCQSVSKDRHPSSAVFQTYLSDCLQPNRQLESLYSVSHVELAYNLGIKLELPTADLIPEIEGMLAKGFVAKDVFKPGQIYTKSVSVWSADKSNYMESIFSYLDISGQCLLLQHPISHRLASLFYQTDYCGTLSVLDVTESHFYHMLLQLGNFTPDILSLKEDVQSFLQDMDRLQFSPSKKARVSTAERVDGFDMSSMEGWRLPDTLVPEVMVSLKKVRGNWKDNKGAYYKNMLRVREAYIPCKVDSLRFDEEKRVIPNESKEADDHRKDVTKVVFEKKMSGMSNNSAVSRTSSRSSGCGSGKAVENKKKLLKCGSSLTSRGALLREKAKSSVNSDSSILNNSSGQVDSATFVKETMVTNKSKAAARVVSRVGQIEDTDELVKVLVDVKEEMIGSRVVEDDVVLAGYAESCVSILLAHLDKTGVSKTSLEELVTKQLLLDVSGVASRYSSTPQNRVGQHKVQVLLRTEVHWLLASQSKQSHYEDNILAHIRQVSLHGGNSVMLEFLTLVLTECYVDRQPELICLLYDELDQERPSQLAILFSPTLGSVAPVSVKSSGGPSSVSSGCAMPAPPPVVVVSNKKASKLARSLKSRPKSFDTSLMGRQINLAAGRKNKKESSKVTTTGRMLSRSRVVVSGRKRHTVVATLTHKSPRKQAKMVKRNLLFDDPRYKSPNKRKSPTITVGKSPRKNVCLLTPSKARRRTPCKMTPGKRHRVLVPETPAPKVVRRKSDGNTSVAETPDKEHPIATPRRERASLALRRKASFYSGTGSRNVQKFEDQFNASWLRGNSSMAEQSSRLDSAESSDMNKSLVLFPHLVGRKRKREQEDTGETSLSRNERESDNIAPSNVRRIKRRLTSMSDTYSDNIFIPLTTSTMAPGASIPDACIKEFNYHQSSGETSTVNMNQTPKKNFSCSEEDFFSPGKRVQFNMTPQPPTPHRGSAVKSILKTPSKTPSKTPTKSPFLTPSARGRSNQTPVKTPNNKTTPSTRRVRLYTTPQKDSQCEQIIPAYPSTFTPDEISSLDSQIGVRKSPARRDLGQSSIRTLPLVPTASGDCTPVKQSNSPVVSSNQKRGSLFSPVVPRENLVRSQSLKLSRTNLDFEPNFASTQLFFTGSKSEQASTILGSQCSYDLDNLSTPKELREATTSALPGVRPSSSMSSSILPPGKLTSDIFDVSALHPQLGNSSSLQDTFSTSTLQCRPIKQQTHGNSNIPPIRMDRESNPIGNILQTTPTKQMSTKPLTPVKFEAGIMATGELELVSPVKRINAHSRSLLQTLGEDDDNEPDEVDNYEVDEELVDLTDCMEQANGPSKTFSKKDSELSLAASSDRGPTPEVGGSSTGYSSEPAPEPSPGYCSDQSSPGDVQVTSPLQQVLREKKPQNRELAKLTDKLTNLYSPRDRRRVSVSRVRKNMNDESFINETAELDAVRDGIGLGTASPNPSSSIHRSNSNKSVDNDTIPPIVVPRELAGLVDKMTPYFSAESKKRNSVKKEQDPVSRVKGIKRRQSEERNSACIVSTKKNKLKKVEDDLIKEEDSIQSVGWGIFETNKVDETKDDLEVRQRAGGKMVIVQSPARFKCEFCTKRFHSRQKFREHKEEEFHRLLDRRSNDEGLILNCKVEEEGSFICDCCGERLYSVGKLLEHKKVEIGQSIQKLSRELQLKAHVEEVPTCELIEPQGTPKLVANLNDSLSNHFTPTTTGRVRKPTERLLNNYTENVVSNSPKMSSKSSKKRLFRAPTSIAVTATSTPNEETNPVNFNRRRSERARPSNISYADLPDFESSMESDISPEVSTTEPPRKPVVIGIKAKKRFVLVNRPSPEKPIVSPAVHMSFPDNNPTETKDEKPTEDLNVSRRSTVQVKDLNNSQHEINDVSSAVDDIVDDDCDPVSVTYGRSPGKYFSIANVTETPTGQIKLRLNRISKPHQGNSTKRTPENVKGAESSLIHRLSRSSAKEIGISPNKLQSIMANTPPRPKALNLSPEKENRGISDVKVSKTPKLRIKKVDSTSPTGSHLLWKAETVISPSKPTSPLKPLPPSLSNRGSPSKTSYSPLSDRSIHKLTMSPIIHTIPDRKSSKKRRVNKQLAYK